MGIKKKSKIKLPKRITMRYKEWLDVAEPDYFAQTDSSIELHWRKMQTITSLSYYFNLVTLIRVENDKLYKLNGAQRMKLWSSDEMIKPEFIAADIYPLTQNEFKSLCKNLYMQQLENLPPHELVLLFYKELDLVFSSDRLYKGFITEALNIALRGKPRAQQDKRSAREKEEINIKKAITLFKKELLTLDQLNLKSELFVTGVLAAALIMLVIDGNNIHFFKRLNKFEGQVSSEGLLDPIEALLVTIDSYKNKRMTQVRIQMELCGKTIKAILLWNQGEKSPKYWTRNSLRVTDYQLYIRKIKGLKSIYEVRDL